jgi:hypothetical protein
VFHIDTILLSLLVCAATAMAQSLSTSVGSDFSGGQVLCQKNGTTHAACSGNWKSGDGTQAAAGGGAANANYGTLRSDAKAVVNCSTGCILGAGTVSGSDFNDTAFIQNAPTSGSFFLIRIVLSGSVSNVSTNSPELQLNIADGPVCAITSDMGRCHVRVPVTGPTASFDFTVGLVSSVNASLNGNDAGTDNEYADLGGRISELAVVDSKGNVFKGLYLR